MPACTIEYPVSVGDILNVKIASLPMYKLDLDSYRDTRKIKEIMRKFEYDGDL